MVLGTMMALVHRQGRDRSRRFQFPLILYSAGDHLTAMPRNAVITRWPGISEREAKGNSLAISHWVVLSTITSDFDSAPGTRALTHYRVSAEIIISLRGEWATGRGDRSNFSTVAAPLSSEPPAGNTTGKVKPTHY